MNASPATLSAALVGAGTISDLHLQGLRRLEHVEVVGIADVDRERAAAKAESYGVDNVFASVDEMLRLARPDIVHILTPPFTHADLAVMAMEHGAHVYVEKPMAASEEDCARMIDAAERTGRELCVGHSLMYDPLMRRALALIADGKLGEVRQVGAVYAFDTGRIRNYDGKKWYRQLGGGLLEDLASHPASVLLALTGAPTRVETVRRGDEITALIEGERAAGTMFVSLSVDPEEVSLEVRGTLGVLRVNFSTMAATLQPARKIPKKLAHGVRNVETAAQLVTQTVMSTARFATKRLDTTKGIHSLLEAFYAAVRAGEPAPVSGEEGRRVVRFLRQLWPEPAAPQPARWVMSRGRSAPRVRGDASSTEPRTALVTGATGFIGRHLVRTLAQRGVHVRALARDPQRAQSLAGPNVDVIIGDFGDPEVLPGLAEGMDVIFHLASVMKGHPEEFERVDVQGGRRLIAEAKRAGARRFVFTSTLGTYDLGDLPDGAVVTEAMIDSPDRVGPYVRAKLLIERELLAATEAGALDAVILRPGLVFGPGTHATLEHLPHMGNRVGNRFVLFGDGKMPLQLTYVANTVDALWLAATSADAVGEVMTIVDDDVPTQRQYVRRLAELTGTPYRVVAIPRAVAWSMGAGVEVLSRALKKKPPTTRRLLIGKTRKLHFDCSRAKRVLGWQPVVSWEEGLERAVEWERERPVEVPRQAAPTPDRALAGASPPVASGAAEQHADRGA